MFKLNYYLIELLSTLFWII